MAKQLNVHDRNSLYNLGWFPVPTLNKYVQRNVDKKIFKLKRLNRDYKTQLYFSLRPRCFKLYKTKIPKVLRLDICFKQSGKLTAKHTELREKIEIMYAQFIYKHFLKRELMKDRNKFILDQGT